MIDPHPPNDDKYDLRGIDRPQPKDDRYKVSIIRFMHDDDIAAIIELRQKEMAKHYKYIGVRQSDIRNALVPEDGKMKPLIGAGDIRLPRMLSELEKLKLVEKSKWISKKWTKRRYYYTLTEDGKKIWDDLQKLKKEKISELFYCLKDLDGMIQRYSGKRLEEKFSLEKV